MLVAIKPYFIVAKNIRVNSTYKKHYIGVLLGKLYNRAVFKEFAK